MQNSSELCKENGNFLYLPGSDYDLNKQLSQLSGLCKQRI